MPKDSVTRFLISHIEDHHYTSSFTKDGYNHLRTYLGNSWKGQPKIFTAPFAKGQSIRNVMKDWNETLVSIKSKWPSLYSFESDLAKKVGPTSIMKPFSERLKDVAHYYEDILLPSSPISESAIAHVNKEFSGLRGLRIRGMTATMENMKKSSNSGAPFFTKRRNVIQDTIPCSTTAYSSPKPINNFVHGEIVGDDWILPAVVGWRGQEGGPSDDDVKQRVVWMFPFSVNVNELQVYQPLIEGAQKLNLVPAWVSMESVDRSITNLFDTKGSDDLIVCTDFSRFDQHFNRDLQNAAKSILSNILCHGASSENWIRDVFPAKYCIGLVIPTPDNEEGQISYLSGEHGMASGSGGTNVDETLTHRALQYEAAILHGSNLNPNSQCLGDDGILTYPGITVKDVVDVYEAHGQECNLEKQYSSTQDCIYLRRWHHKDYRDNGICVGVYSTFRALGRLRYLERYMDPEFWSPEMVALRQLSILENCKYHPLKEQFVEFCMKRDKYRLGIDLPGFLDRLPELAVQATDYMPDFLGYTRTLQGEGPSGINDWWVVNYLKSKR